MCDIHLTGREPFSAHQPTGATVAAHALHERVDRLAAEMAGQVVDWRHHLHRHPELSNREVETARMVAEHLDSLSLDELRTGIAGHGVDRGAARSARPGSTSRPCGPTWMRCR